jgi:hypothetical protein
MRKMVQTCHDMSVRISDLPPCDKEDHVECRSDRLGRFILELKRIGVWPPVSDIRKLPSPAKLAQRITTIDVPAFVHKDETKCKWNINFRLDRNVDRCLALYSVPVMDLNPATLNARANNLGTAAMFG